jgi:small subunit ribosomal protein S6
VSVAFPLLADLRSRPGANPRKGGFLYAQPDLDETAAAVVTDKIKGWITDGGGTVSKVDVWGKRHLAFPIKKQNEGLYILVQAEFAPSLCATLERNMRFLEPVLRFLITSVE